MQNWGCPYRACLSLNCQFDNVMKNGGWFVVPECAKILPQRAQMVYAKGAKITEDTENNEQLIMNN